MLKSLNSKFVKRMLELIEGQSAVLVDVQRFEELVYVVLAIALAHFAVELEQNLAGLLDRYVATVVHINQAEYLLDGAGVDRGAAHSLGRRYRGHWRGGLHGLHTRHGRRDRRAR